MGQIKDIKILNSINKNNLREYFIFKNDQLSPDFDKFKSLKLSENFLNHIKNFKIDCKSLEDGINIISNFNKISVNGWAAYFEQPRHWYEYIGGVWRLHFNNRLTEDLADGAATVEDIVQQIWEAFEGNPFAEIIVDIGKIATAIFEISSVLWKENNKGNGTLIRFFEWVIPDDVQPSYHKW